MIGFYLFSAIAGGVLLVVSAMVGHHGHDFDGHADLDADAGHGLGGAIAWLPIFSLRFWTYFLAATGATGLLLTRFSGTDPAIVMWLSIGTGLACGLVVVFLIRMLTRYDSDSSARVDDLLGLDAKVLVRISQNVPGKVRCVLKGDTLDLLALSQDETVLEAGSDAIIVAMENDKARVVPREALYG